MYWKGYVGICDGGGINELEALGYVGSRGRLHAERFLSRDAKLLYL